MLNFNYIFKVELYIKHMKMTVFWYMTLSSLVIRYQYFKGTLKMDRACSFEAMVSTYKITWHHVPGDSNLLTGSCLYIQHKNACPTSFWCVVVPSLGSVSFLLSVPPLLVHSALPVFVGLSNASSLDALKQQDNHIHYNYYSIQTERKI
jgi:hypothetical protein